MPHTDDQHHVHTPDACAHSDRSLDCCSGLPDVLNTEPREISGAHGHHGHAANQSLPGLTTAATVHCLTGCAIGEFAGLAIGVSLGLSPWTIITLATLMGFASGYALGLLPLVRRGLGWMQAFKTIWIGETISIAVMEFAMNFTDYHVGGVQAASVLSLQFWLGYAAALPAGFIAAWPANYWLLKRNFKQPCH